MSQDLKQENRFLSFLSKTGKFFLLLLKRFLVIFGFNKDDKFVKQYLTDSNARSGLFLGSVIAILEIWLIGRQFHKYIIPKWGSAPAFDLIFSYISQFILFFLVGITIFIYSLTYKNEKIGDKAKLIANLIPSTLTFFYSFFLIKEMVGAPAFDSSVNILSNVLLILMYISGFMVASSSLIYSLTRFFKGKDYELLKILVILCFALMCLVFGIKVSYSDHLSSKHKEIICFLTMVIYVACLLVYKPWVVILLHTGIFIGFYVLIHNADVARNANEQLSFLDSDLINYITFLVSLCTVSVMLYHQRRDSAVKDEELEYQANYDLLTGIHNFEYFIRELEKYQTNNKINNDKIIIYLNINDFKLYNDQRGFVEGNNFLIKVGQILNHCFDDGVVCRQTDDHYIIFIDHKNFYDRIQGLHDEILYLDKEIKVEISFGGYQSHIENEDVRRMVDKARYACSVASSLKNVIYLEYDLNMHKEYHQLQYIIHNVDNAISNGWIRPYYQPLVNAKDKKICAFEALTRWIDPKYGFLTPGLFIPILEKTKLIHKVDTYMIESVCKDLRYCLDNNLPTVPISINFSRLDFELIDAIKVLEDIVIKYDIPHHLIHVEITESALMQDANILYKDIKILKDKGYSLWLDDFGSGYSSLNVLKDYEFDVLKIDLLFLKNFSSNPKAKDVINAIIALADRLNLRTVSEGVENKEQADFLLKAGCEILQGYLFGKPISFIEVQEKIKNKDFILEDEHV